MMATMRWADRDGDVWEPLASGRYWLPPAGEPRTLADIRRRFGPLERMPDGDQSGATDGEGIQLAMLPAADGYGTGFLQ